VCGNPDIQPTWPLLLKAEKVDESLFFSLFKLCQNNPLVIPFQNVVW
jgi:hypothetical protein